MPTQTSTAHGAPAERRASGRSVSGLGGGWVAVQIVLIAAIFASALLGLEWPGRVEPLAWGAGSLLLVLGAALLAAGGLGLGAALTPFPAPRAEAQLQTSGIYGRVRHPMYGGGILVGLGWSTIFATPSGLVLTVVLALFADLKSRHEERRLEQTYPDYGEYRERTRHRLLPFIW